MDSKSMILKTPYPVVWLRPGREKSILKGHPWLFSGAIDRVDSDIPWGNIVTCRSSDEKNLGLGFYHPGTDIAVRLLTRDVAEQIDSRFWKKRIQQASILRDHIIPSDTNAFRLINAEGDLMPGLIVDQYDRYLVLTIGTTGMERFREDILTALVHERNPLAIIERSEGKSRTREGLEDRSEICYGGPVPQNLQVKENGFPFHVDILSGQKTGFFLDQRVNRELAKLFSKGATVLNCFSYTGAFSVYCAAGGAKQVISIESSHSANAVAENNLVLNGLTSVEHPIVSTDVFHYLRESTDQFNLIILDPPAFAKSFKDIGRAARGYKEIHLSAMQRLRKNGYLMTFSCSNFISENLFEKIILGAAFDTGTSFQTLRVLQAGPDHPVHSAHPEGKYLKGLMLRKVD